MTTTEIILAAISVISFLIGLYSFIRAEIRKAKEKANVELMKEKLRSVHSNLKSLYHSTDAIVQMPKSRAMKIEELQDLARIVRGQIYILANYIQKTRNQLENVKYGRMIASDENLDDLEQLEPNQMSK